MGFIPVKGIGKSQQEKKLTHFPGNFCCSLSSRPHGFMFSRSAEMPFVIAL